MERSKAFDTTDVIISGCGPTGALLSAHLGQAGIPNVVLEKEPEITSDPRGIALDEDGIRLLQGIGLYKYVFTDIGTSQLARALQFSVQILIARRYGNIQFRWWYGDLRLGGHPRAQLRLLITLSDRPKEELDTQASYVTSSLCSKSIFARLWRTVVSRNSE